MVDYVDIRETYFVAGDFDQRKRYIKTRTGTTGTLAVCSGVTWTLGDYGTTDGEPYQNWKWSLGARGSLTFTQPGSGDDPPGNPAPTPSPLRVTSCMI